jgi:hypothetical protein
MVEDLVAGGASHGDACQQVADKTSRAKSTIVTQHHLYRKSQGASPRAMTKPRRAKAPAKPRAAKSSKRAGSTDTAKAATNAIRALVDENAQLRRDLAAAEQRIERMLAAGKN